MRGTARKETGNPLNSSKHTELANHAWSVADLLRGDYKQSDYGKVILPFTVLRRLECVLEPTRQKVAEEVARFEGEDIDTDHFLRRASGHSFYNKSDLTLKKIAADPQNAAQLLQIYVAASPTTPVRSSTSTSSPSRSRSLTAPTCSTRSSASSPTSTCTPRTCPTTTWGTSSRS